MIKRLILVAGLLPHPAFALEFYPMFAEASADNVMEATCKDVNSVLIRALNYRVSNPTDGPDTEDENMTRTVAATFSAFISGWAVAKGLSYDQAFDHVIMFCSVRSKSLLKDIE